MSPQSPLETRLTEYHPGMAASTWRARSDAWEYLRFAVKQLVHGTGDVDDEVWRDLETLKTIELYWAGFGQRWVTTIEQLIADGNYQAALDRIGVVVHRLRGDTVTDEKLDEEDPELSLDLDPRPRFEVLIVDEARMITIAP